jgi:hypothetical protein
MSQGPAGRETVDQEFQSVRARLLQVGCDPRIEEFRKPIFHTGEKNLRSDLVSRVAVGNTDLLDRNNFW